MDADNTAEPAAGPPPPRLVDYYRFLGVPRTAPAEMIVEAYLLKIAEADGRTAQRAERALAVLSDPTTRAAYDQQLAVRPGKAPAEWAPAAARRAGRSPAPARPVPPPPGRRSAQVAQPAASRGSYLSGRWALALIPIAVLILAIFVLKGGPPGSEDGSSGTYNQAIIGQLSARAVSAALGPDGVQTLDVVVNGDSMSYRPDVIKVKAGVPARFNLTVEGRDPG
jgi:curved DNA-binding protein CbpA